MLMRRPHLIRWNSYMSECIEVLQSSSDALPSDITLCHWVCLQHLAEQASEVFSMDDPPRNINVSEPAAQRGIKDLEKQLEDWRQQVKPEHRTREYYLFTQPVTERLALVQSRLIYSFANIHQKFWSLGRTYSIFTSTKSLFM